MEIQTKRYSSFKQMSNKPQLLVKLHSSNAKLPARQSTAAAGYDLTSAQTVVVPARGKANISTDISIAIPSGTYGRVAPRSGLTIKNGIDVGAGVIDFDFRGVCGVVLFNHSDVDFQVNVGDRIAQLILEKIETNAEVVQVESLEQTSRGSGGFGSTGV